MAPDRRDALATAISGGAAMAAALGVGRFVLTPILPHMIDALGLTASQAGFIASANFLGYLIGAVVAASPAFSGDMRKWLIAGLVVSVATTAGMAVSGHLFVLMGLRFIGGAASAFVLVFASTLVLETLARNRQSGLVSLHFAGVGLGISLSAVLVAVVVALSGDWRAQWLWSGGLGAIGLVLVFFLCPTARLATVSSAATTDGDVGSASGLGGLIAAYGLFGFGYVITATFISTIVRLDEGAVWLETAAWLAVGLAAIPSVVAWSQLAAKIGPMRGYALACLVQAIGVVISVALAGPVAILIAGVLLGATFMGLTALGIDVARKAAPGNPTRAIAMMTAAFGIGQMIGPSVGGLLADHLGSFTAPSLLAAAALLLSAALAYSWGPDARR